MNEILNSKIKLPFYYVINLYKNRFHLFNGKARQSGKAYPDRSGQPDRPGKQGVFITFNRPCHLYIEAPVN